MAHTTHLDDELTNNISPIDFTEKIIIAGVDAKGGIKKRFTEKFRPKTLKKDQVWDENFKKGFFILNIEKLYGNTTIKDNPSILTKFSDADIIILSIDFGDIIKIKNNGRQLFPKAKLVLLICSKNKANQTAIEEFSKLDFSCLVPNALVIGCLLNNVEKEIDSIIDIVTDTKLIGSLIHEGPIYYTLENERIFSLLNATTTTKYFLYHKDYNEEEPFKNYESENCAIFVQAMNNVAGRWMRNDLIPYVCGVYPLPNELASLNGSGKITDKIYTAAFKMRLAGFYNDAILKAVGTNAENGKPLYGIQGKIHYSFIDIFKEKTNISLTKADLKAANVGVDCSGFASPFLYEAIKSIKDDNNITYDSPFQYDNMMGIKMHDATIIKERGSFIVSSIDQVLPGDIMRTIEDGNGVGFHIRVVYNVEDTNTEKKIYTIESTSKFNGITKKVYKYNLSNNAISVYRILNGDKEEKIKEEFSLIESPIIAICGQDKKKNYTYHVQEKNGAQIIHLKITTGRSNLKQLARHSSTGFDHIVESTEGDKYPFRAYYFRRPKYIHNFFLSLNLPELIKENKEIQDYNQRVKDCAILTRKAIQTFENDIRFIHDFYDEFINNYEGDLSQVDTFSYAIAFYWGRINQLARFKSTISKIECNLRYSDKEKSCFDFIFQLSENLSCSLTQEIALEAIYKDLFYKMFGIQYDKDAVENAVKYMEMYLTIFSAYKMVKHIQKKIKDASENSYYISSVDGIITSDHYVKSEEAIVTPIFKELLAELKGKKVSQISGSTSENLKEINSYLKLYSSVGNEELLKLYEYKCAYYCIKAFGFNYGSIISYEQTTFEYAHIWGELLKFALLTGTGILLGGFSPLVQVLVDFGLSNFIDVTDTLVSGKKRTAGEWAMNIALNAVQSVVFVGVPSVISTKKYLKLTQKNFNKEISEQISRKYDLASLIKKRQSQIESEVESLFPEQIDITSLSGQLEADLKLVTEVVEDIPAGTMDNIFKGSQEALNKLREEAKIPYEAAAKKLKEANSKVTTQQKKIEQIQNEINEIEGKFGEEAIIDNMSLQDLADGFIVVNKKNQLATEKTILDGLESEAELANNTLTEAAKVLNGIDNKIMLHDSLLEIFPKIKDAKSNIIELARKYPAASKAQNLHKELEEWIEKNIGSHKAGDIEKKLLSDPKLKKQYAKYYEEYVKECSSYTEALNIWREGKKEIFNNIKATLAKYNALASLVGPTVNALKMDAGLIKSFDDDSSIDDIINQNLRRYEKLKDKIEESKVTDAINDIEIADLVKIIAANPFISFYFCKFRIEDYDEDMPTIAKKMGFHSNYSKSVHISYETVLMLANDLQNDDRIDEDAEFKTLHDQAVERCKAAKKDLGL